MAGQYTCIRSGFRLEPFLQAQNDPALRARHGLKPEDFVVGKIARLTELKGHDDLFTAAPRLVQRHPQMKFLLVGDGRYHQRLKQAAREMGLEKHFVFTGLVAPEAVAPLVGIMNVLVHLSQREGLARALPQALAAGKPILAYDCDGAGEVCRPGETGFLVSPGDLDSFEEYLGRLAEDTELGRRLGLAGRKLVQEQFSIEQMVDGLEALYRRLTQRPGT
jgi:glycosyltransferase involved in cell wall biosynthesis